MPNQPSGYQQAMDAATQILAPYIDDILSRINVDEFTTLEFIGALQLDPAAKQAFERALQSWPENDERMSRMVIHGQVVPVLLRSSALVEWMGYAHGEEDPYGVPAWWRRLSTDDQNHPPR